MISRPLNINGEQRTKDIPILSRLGPLPFALVLALLGLCACDQPPTNGGNGDDSTVEPWTRVGLSQRVWAFRLFSDRLYVIVQGGASILRTTYRQNMQAANYQWELLDTDNSREIFDVYVHENHPDQIMLAGLWGDPVTHTIMVSQDDGKTWTAADSGLVFSLASNDSLIRAYPKMLSSVGPAVFVSGFMPGPYISVDFGQHWDTLSTFPFYEFGNSFDIFLHPTDPQLIWGIYRFHVPLGFGWYLIKSTDAGLSWETVRPNYLDGDDSFSQIFLHESRSNTIYHLYKGLRKSDDGGTIWNRIFPPDSLKFSSLWVIADLSRGDHLFGMAGEDQDASTIHRLWETWDGGVSWTPVDWPYEFRPRYPMVYDPNSNTIFMASDSGVVRYIH